MALIIEDGSQAADSNSYIDSIYLESFLTDRGLLSDNLDTDEKREAMILRSMDVLNTQDYLGSRVSNTQSLPFPRSGICLSDNRVLASDSIPDELKQAAAWLVYYIDAGSDPSSTATQLVKREKVDTLEIEYQDGSSFDSKTIYSLPNVKNLLKYLVGFSNSIGRH